MRKNKKKRRFIEKPSCWKLFSLLCWLSGFGGVLLSTIVGLSFYKPDVSFPFINYVFLVIGTIVFLMSIIGIRIRSQWASTLMEIRGYKERSIIAPSNEELCKLTDLLVGFLGSFESMNKETKAKNNQNQKEIMNSLNSLRISLDNLNTTPSQMATLITKQGEDIKSIMSSLGGIEDLLSQKVKFENEQNKRKAITEEDVKEEIKKEINSHNDRLKYV